MKKNNKKSFNPYMVFGINGVVSLLKAKKLEIISIHIMIGSKAEREKLVKDLININKNKLQRIPKKEFLYKYSGLKTQGVVVYFKGKLYKDLHNLSKVSKNYSLLILDNIEDPQNFGQIIRTAECAGIDGIIIPEHNSVDLTNTSIQISQGAFLHIPIYKCTNINQVINDLKTQCFWIIGFENSINAKKWSDLDYKGKTALVFGSEGKGIRKKVMEKCDFSGTIPMQGRISSLNVSASISAIVFERLRQLDQL